MKNSKIALFAGALTLIVGSIYATKPAKKAAATKAYARSPFNATLFAGVASPYLTTATDSGKKAKFSTVSGSSVTLRTSSASNAKTIYIK
ncbi:hypothetical protein SAMN05428988_1554 [Chitinophaga sp. YR573]|uniref:hypothetical protein n=1 Tax=Chitinophaga sp. YR573 TaxID=1881040 RepID=UPI0008B05119|nr:hypothetical protein [Chitinophaga sp. YR573]SEW04675.1 hypothetical protein SAMN05428988_1554 [Chitinophaga sp. YR573]